MMADADPSAQGDFDIASLAAFLHVDPAQVARLADRGKLPARRVGGQWRFARAEIHHWLEQRIGVSSEAELVEMEDALSRRPGATPADDVVISEMLPLEAIEAPLAARTRGSVIRSMVEVAARTGWLWDVAKMTAAVEAREEMMSTALDIGVALLHPRRPLPTILDRPFLALGRTATSIPFGGEGVMTDIFFLICSVEDRGHLRALARLSRLLTDPTLLLNLRVADGAFAVRQAMIDAERRLDA